jgi:hypothetical protein
VVDGKSPVFYRRKSWSLKSVFRLVASKSYIHFVGPTEQSYRVANGTPVENKINLQNFTATYQMTSRFSVQADIPVLLASRHTDNSPVIYTSQGIGDSSVMVQGWIWNPKENTRGNIQLGLGVLFPTCKDNVANTVDDRRKWRRCVRQLRLAGKLHFPDRARHDSHCFECPPFHLHGDLAPLK